VNKCRQFRTPRIRDRTLDAMHQTMCEGIIMETLKEKLGEELYKQVTEKLGDTKLMIDDGQEHIPKSRLDEVIKQRDTAKEELVKTGEKIKEFATLVENNKELSEKVKTLNTDIETSKTDYDAKVEKMNFNHSLESAIRKTGALNIKSVIANIDTSKITLDGEHFKGLDDQIKSIKESDPYLFGKSINKGSPPPGTNDGDIQPTQTAKGQNEDGTWGKGNYATKGDWANNDSDDYAKHRPAMGLKS